MSSHGRIWGYRVNCPHRVKGCIRNEIRQGLGLIQNESYPIDFTGIPDTSPPPFKETCKVHKEAICFICNHVVIIYVTIIIPVYCSH